eukprot:SAG11_NODE_3976_length_2125_cov_5.330207_3_plen_146_part_00
MALELAVTTFVCTQTLVTHALPLQEPATAQPGHSAGVLAAAALRRAAASASSAAAPAAAAGRDGIATWKTFTTPQNSPPARADLQAQMSNLHTYDPSSLGAGIGLNVKDFGALGDGICREAVDRSWTKCTGTDDGDTTVAEARDG